MDRIPDMLKRLHMIENILFKMVDVVDIARNYDERLKALEHKPKGRKIKMDDTQTITNVINAKNTVIRELKIKEAYTHYHALIQFLKSQPCDYEAMRLAFINMDQGMHWVEKIFEVTNFVPLPATAPIQPEPISEASALVDGSPEPVSSQSVLSEPVSEFVPSELNSEYKVEEPIQACC